MKGQYEYDGIVINSRFDYWNPGFDGKPMLYDKKTDIFYPLIDYTPGCWMIFDDFIHGLNLRLNYKNTGMLDLNHVWAEIKIWVKIGED